MNPTSSLNPPGTSKTSGKPKFLRPCFFKKKSKKLTTGFLGSRHAQLAIYTVFDEESESEGKKCQILEQEGKYRKN